MTITIRKCDGGWIADSKTEGIKLFTSWKLLLKHLKEKLNTDDEPQQTETK